MKSSSIFSLIAPANHLIIVQRASHFATHIDCPLFWDKFCLSANECKTTEFTDTLYKNLQERNIPNIQNYTKQNFLPWLKRIHHEVDSLVY